MYAKGKSSSVPSDSQAREKLALYVYEYLLHVGAQKSAQTFLSEIRWEKNITLGEPPGFLHSWWCVFWDLYCAAPERRDTCEHSSEAKAFHDYSAAAAPSPVLGSLPLERACQWAQCLRGFFSPLCLHVTLVDPDRPSDYPVRHWEQPGHPSMGGPMQRMTPPRGMVPLGPQNYSSGMRPPLNALVGPGMPGMNMGPGVGRPWPNPSNANSTPYSSASPGSYVGPPGGGGPPGTPIMPSPADSTNSGDNMYTLINTAPSSGGRTNFPMGAGGEGPLSGMSGMESHHINGSLGSGDMDSLPKNSPGNLSMSNQPGTPREEGEMGGNFLNPFQNESFSPNMTMNPQTITMFLQVFLFALALCSVTAEDDLNCAELLLEDPQLITGDWIVHAMGSNNGTIFNMLQKVTSSWVKISKTDEKDKYNVQVYDKVDDTCYTRQGDGYEWDGRELTLTLSGKPFNTKHKGVYLQTHSQNIAVWLDQTYHQHGDTFITGKNIVLLKKSRAVPAKAMKQFKQQAKCENIDVLELPSTTDLCAEEKRGTAE
ncbi:hypothetical protein WMY93_004601 [Mugilogobius chulae]|uniref:LisH domain-containing protein n=1 Tax=Mugilogobius chulae TaxID=88201 RepID=A0AAW0PVB9_9GOBI